MASAAQHLGALARAAGTEAPKFAPAVAVVLLPKCPACVAAYASVFAVFGVQLLPGQLVWPLTLGLLGAALAFVARQGWRLRRVGPFALALASAAATVALKWLTDVDWPVYAAAATFGASVMWSRVQARSCTQAATR